MKSNPYRSSITCVVAAALALSSTIAGQAQITLNPNTRVTPNTSKPGFLWRVFANQANQVNSSQRTEDAVAGLLRAGDGTLLPNLADPSAQGVAIAAGTGPTPENGVVQFEIDSVINVAAAGGSSQGTFTPDDQMPGLPATDSSNNGISVEILTYLDLPVGTYTMGVASDDGFLTSAGNLKDIFQGTRLGEYSGGRGTGETLFTFSVTQAGVYPFRTTYEQGGGGSDLEWYSLVVSGGVTNKVLINDTANGGIRAYRAATVPPQTPYIKSVVPGPAPRQLNVVSRSVTLVLVDGDNVAINDASIDFKIDGNTVTNKVRTGNTVTLTYTPTGIQFPNETHTATLSFTGAGGFTRTESWTFRNLKNVILPAPVITENFDSTPEGSRPAGWVAWNYTVDCDEDADSTAPTEENLRNQRSDIYKDWVVVSPTNTVPYVDDDGVDTVNATETINGQPLTLADLFSGNFLYMESDSRCNGTNPSRPVAPGDPEANYGQTQFIDSKPFNLSAVRNPVLSFTSGYEQNQDSYGGLEYSVDRGTNWMPVLYFLDDADIAVKANGATDGLTTFNRTQTDTSLWVANGVQKGNTYGDAVSAPINDAISDFIVPRINDDFTEGKRIEIVRLPAAANKADVRLRFSATGTDSWYWFVDNIAFYDIAPASAPAGRLNAPARSGSSVVISWTGAGSLEESSSINGPWTPSTSQTNPQNVPATGTGAKFYRLRN